MKQYRTNMMTALVAMAMMCPGMTHADNTSEDSTPVVSDVKDSGCTSHTRAANGTSLVLTKEGDIVTCELNGFVANCGVDYFDIDSEYKKGTDAPDSLLLKVKPVVPAEADCTCAYNVSFTIRDVKTNTFYLDCWWYEGQVELKEEPLILQNINENVTIDGLKYNLRKTTHQAMLKNFGNPQKGELRIPSKLSYEGQDYSVTSISFNSFIDNTELTKLTIPRTVKNVDFDKDQDFHNIFSSCTALESIDVEDGNPVLCSVEGVLFNKERTKLLTFPPASPSTTYTIPDGVKFVDNAAFAYNQHLIKVNIPDEVTTLGAMTFSENKSLEEIRLSSNLKVLGYGLFKNCKSLKSVTIPQGILSIEMYVFQGCKGLTSVTLPESVESVDAGVFGDCTSLKSIILSPKMKEIPNSMFENCSSLTDISIPNSVNYIGRAFNNCTSLKSLDIPESVNGIRKHAFTGCRMGTMYIRGVIETSYVTSDLFYGMGTRTEIYVLPSEVEKFQAIYGGAVYPLSFSNQPAGISDVNQSVITSTDFYDLQGRHITGTPSKGVYIENGRKRMVK